MLGVGLWLRDIELCKQLMEKMARAQYIQGNKDPFRCLLFYAALNKPKVVATLFRASRQNDKIAELLSQDFTQDRWKLIAGKNAFALLARQRYEEAIGFFLLAGKVSDACRVCVKNLGDYQLAVLLARVLEGDSSPILADIFDHHLVMMARANRDAWLACIASLLKRDAAASLHVFTPGVLEVLSAPDEQAFFVNAMRDGDLLPTRYDACEPTFIKERLLQAPFWGKATSERFVVFFSCFFAFL